MPAIMSTAQSHGIAVVEDSAQAHGATWLGRHAGTFGTVGCFSMQNGKVLTGGEGGAVVTDDPRLAGVLEELRADSRRYRSDQARPGELELDETATVMGANFCLNEFSAAVLCAQLAQLDAQHEIRNRNHAILDALLQDVPNVRLLRAAPRQTRLSIYEAPIIFDTLPAGKSNADVAGALTAELGVAFYPPREPLDRSRLLRPSTKPALEPLARRYHELQRGRRYPNAEWLAGHAVLTHHSTFLGDESDMADIATAIIKVTTASAW